MHILLVTPAYGPTLGGGEQYVHALAAHLAIDHAVTVVTSNALTEEDFWQGRPLGSTLRETRDGPVRIIRCRLPGFRGGQQALFAWRRSMVALSTIPTDQTPLLSRMADHMPPLHGLEEALALVEQPVDLVHTFNLSWENSAMAAWRYAAERRIPLVVTPFAHVGSSATARNISMDHQRRLLLAANQIQALSSAEKAGLALWGISGERIDVVGGGFVPPETPPQRGANPFGVSGRYALFIGRLSFDKGAMHAAEAILALRRAGVDISLVLAGYTTPAFDRFYDALPHDQHPYLRPIGRVSDAEKQQLLAGAELLLLPSRADALGIVLLEAWSHGKPVVAARAGGIPGVVADGEDGLLLPFGDVRGIAAATRRLLEGPELAHRLGARGRQKVLGEYAWPAVTERVLAGYEKARAHFQQASPRIPTPLRPAAHPPSAAF